MSLFTKLLQAVRSWRRSPAGRPKPSQRVAVAMEYLDHRQLLAVNFTGNAPIDFPATLKPGVVVVPPNPTAPGFSEANFLPNTTLQNLVKASGFDITAIRLSYTAADDTLSVGLEGPNNPKDLAHREVIAGDADNNGNSGQAGTLDPTAPPNVDPAVQAAAGGGFADFPDLGGSEYMGAFLDLKGTGKPDVVAGIGTGPSKLYQVAQVVNTGLVGRPDTNFGASLPQNTGRLFLNNDPNTPNMEFTITEFSRLYLQETGHALTNSSVIGVGAYAGSGSDFATETTLPPQKVTVGTFTVPAPAPPVCPPAVLAPTVLINYHSNNHINTAHSDLVRVQVLGSATFDVDRINAATVRLGGASPLSDFDRHIGHYPYGTRTFVFRGSDINLPAGTTQAHVTGHLNDGTAFDSVYQVYNKNDSFYSPAQIAARNNRLSARGLAVPNDNPTTPTGPTGPVVAPPITVDYGIHTPAVTPAAAAAHAAPIVVKMPVFAARDTGPARKSVRPARLGVRLADFRNHHVQGHPMSAHPRQPQTASAAGGA